MSRPTHASFDRLAANPKWHSFTAVERRIVAGFVRRWHIRPGERVLEPGCGSGRLTEILAARTGPGGHVLAFDSSPAFLAGAARRALPAHVTLRRANAATLRLPRGAFDHVVCFNVFPHLVPHGEIVRRLVRALRVGGTLLIAHTAGRARINRVHRQAGPTMHDHLLPTPRDLARLLRAAGVEPLEIEYRPDRIFVRAIRPDPNSER